MCPPRTALLAVTAALVGAGPSLSPANEPLKGERFALLVGVQAYERKELKSLRFAEKDVTVLAQVLQGGGYRPENVRLLTMTRAVKDNNPRWLPLARNIRHELRLLLRDRVEGDSVVVAFAGHGVQFKDSDECFFCPANAQLSDKSTLVSLGEVYRELEKCKASFKLLLVDACRNDPFTDLTRDAGEQVESVTRPHKKRPPGGTAVLFGCSAGEKAFEDEGLGHGVFFHFVIEGLRGEAAKDAGEDITLPLLEHFVQRRVAAHVGSEFSARQMPERVGSTRGHVPLMAGPPGDRFLRAGLAKKGKGDLKGAVADLTRAVQANPKSAEAYCHRGEAQFDLGHPTLALADCDRAIRLKPDYAYAYKIRGLVRRSQGDYPQAIADCTRSIELDGTDPGAYNVRGWAHWLHKDPRRALADFDRAIALNPKYFWAYGNRGYVYNALKKPDRAVADYSRAIQLHPNHFEFYAGRGYAYEQQGDLDRAQADYRRAFDLAQTGDPASVPLLRDKLRQLGP